MRVLGIRKATGRETTSGFPSRRVRRRVRSPTESRTRRPGARLSSDRRGGLRTASRKSRQRDPTRPEAADVPEGKEKRAGRKNWRFKGLSTGGAASAPRAGRRSTTPRKPAAGTIAAFSHRGRVWTVEAHQRCSSGQSAHCEHDSASVCSPAR